MTGSLGSKPVSVSPLTAIGGAFNARPVSVGNLATMAGAFLARPAAVAYTPAKIADPDLVGIWHMDGNWGDSSGNDNNGVPFNGVAFSTDRRGGTQAGSFDGSDDHVFVRNSTTLNPSSQITVSAWYKPSSFSGTGNDSLVDKAFTSHTAPYYQYHLGVSGNLYTVAPGGRFSFSLTLGGVNRGVATPANFWTPGNWYHIVGTYDGSEIRLYVNGVLIDSKPASGTINNYGKDLFIGRFGNLTSCLPGVIDEVAIYKRALNAEEIAVQYANGVVDPEAPAPPGLVIPPAVVGSASVELSGARTAGTSIWVNNKKITPAAESTDWSGSYATLQPGGNLLYVTAVDASFRQSQPVIATVFYDNLPPVVVGASPANNSNTARTVSSVSFDLFDAKSPLDLSGSLLNAVVVNLAGQQIPGAWSYSGTNTITFTPSVPFPQDTYTVTVHPVDAVGNRGQHQIVFTNHDTAQPVTRISVSGAKDNAGWYSTPATVTLTADDGGDGAGIERIEYSLDAGASWEAFTVPFPVQEDGLTTVLFRATDRAGNLETPPKTAVIKINKTGLVGFWRMDGDWTDSSLLANNGAAVNGAGFSSSAKIGTNSGSFNGSNHYATVPDSASLRLTTAMTLAAWIKPNDVGNYRQIISKLGDPPGLAYQIGLAPTGRLRADISADGTAYDAVTSSSSPLTAGSWHHVATTFDRGVWKLYVNGVEVGSKTSTITSINANATPLNIGRTPANIQYFNGLIDEAAVYNRALSAGEIQGLYRDYVVNQPTVALVQTPTRSATITLSGIKPANTAVVINGITVVPLDEALQWQAQYTLANGTNNLLISALDGQSFNSLPVPLTVVLDTEAPRTVSSTPADRAITNATPAAVTVNLADSYSPLDLAATVAGATVTEASGLAVAGEWVTSGSGLTGSVTFNPQTPFAEGSYTVTINPADALGNEAREANAEGAKIGFTIDTTPPAPPTIAPVTGPVNTTSKIISGTKSADSGRVIVNCAGAGIGMVSYPSATSWNVTVTNLKEGSNTVTASAADAAGNTSASSSMSFVVDVTPPGKPSINPPLSPTKSASATLTGSKDAGSWLFLNNVKTADGFADTAWSHTATLSEGSNSFSLFAKDEAGNQGQAASVAVVRDTTPPAIASSTPAANSATATAESVAVNLSDSHAGADLRTSLEGATVKNSTGAVVAGSWSVSGTSLLFSPAAALAEGSYLITLYPIDILGNKGSASFSFTVDRAAPTVQGVALSPATPVKAGVVYFTLTFSEPMNTGVAPVVTVTRPAFFGNTTYQLAGSWQNATTWKGSYNFSADSGDATYTIRAAAARDVAGNVMAEQAAGSFVLDTTPPDKPAVAAVTSPTRTPIQTLTGTKQADTAIVINSVVRVPGNSSLNWSYNYPLNEGGNTLSVIARDAAGNDSQTVLPAPAVTLDTTPPLFTIDSYKSPSPTVTQTISGTREPGAQVKLNGVTIVEAADLNATWSHTLTLTDGINNRLVFTAADALGNSSTRTLDILCETAPPPALAAGMLAADGSGKGSEVTLSWPSYVETSVLGYYRVYHAAADFASVTGRTPAGTVTKGTRSFKVTGLTQGSRYYFAVVPVSVSGNSDPAINTASAVPSDTVPPEEVGGLTASAGYIAADGNTVTLAWTPSADSTGDLADQIVYLDAGAGYEAGTPLGKTATGYSRKGLNDASLYKFKIATRDNLGHESAGSVVTAVTRLANPSGLVATPGNQKVTLTWTPVSSPYLKLYNIYRLKSEARQSDVSAMSLIKSQSSPSFTDTGLPNDTSYQYAVTVVNISGAERTAAQSVTGVPRGDTTGPVLAGVNVSANQILTAPVTITASASDQESAVSRLEIYIDGVLAHTQNGSTISYAWNVVGSSDGNHTVRIAAYDAVGNKSEQSLPVVVSVAAPPMPVITSSFPAPIGTTSVTVSGTAAWSSSVSLRVNGVTVGQPVAVGANGTFTFTGVAVLEGNNYIAAKASNRGGDSLYSADTRVVVVTSAPAAPVALAVKKLSGGSLQFSWQSGGSGDASYNLYQVPSGFTSLAGLTPVKAEIPYLLKEYIPADEASHSYVVSAVNAAGVESAPSNVVSAAADRSAPEVAGITFSADSGASADGVYGPGKVNAAVTVSEALGETPFLSLEPQSGSPVIVPLVKVDDTRYTGSFTIDASSPYGPTTWRFSAKDMFGNRGNRQGTGAVIDNRGPVAGVTAPLTLLKTSDGAASVSFTLDEASSATPVVTLRAAYGTSAEVTSLASGDGGRQWSGTIDPSQLGEGSAQFAMTGAVDRFGNRGNSIKSGTTIVLYKNVPPPSAVPGGLAAKPAKGGSVLLSWSKVSDAQGYNVYREGAGDAAAVVVGSVNGIAAAYTDTPESDGSYSYSVASLGLLGVESVRSAAVVAVSDRTAPPIPSGLLLSMTSSGVNAVWDAATAPAEIPASYRIYRSAADFSDVAGMTPAATSRTNSATDPSPSTSKRFYAVTALDALGNESAPCVARQITFPVAPVADLLLTVVDQGKPSLSWSSGEPNLQGFHIYRNGVKINSIPTSSVSYSDGYYAGGSITYGVSAVDANGTESPVREVTLPALSIGLKQGTVLHRGLLETATLVASLPAGASSLTIDAVTVGIGKLPPSTENGPFTVTADTPVEISKVVSTEATAPAQEAVVVSAILHPTPGVTVKITRSSLASLLGSGSALEIFNDPLVRGTQAKVRLKVNNLGTARTEFLTSENGQATGHVTVYLKDQDGNVLAQGRLNQQTGAGVVSSGSYSTARIEPGESFLTDPVVFTIPASAPYRVSLQAVIDATYYHYSLEDRVTAPGLTQSMEGTIADVSYVATARTDKGVYKQGETVAISGETVSATTGEKMPLVPVRIGVSVKGFDRFFTVNSDANGSFSYRFTPASNEAGSYAVWAAHPDLADRSVQAQFSLIGLQLSPTQANIRLLKGQSYDIPVTLANLGPIPLNGLNYTPNTSVGVSASVPNGGSETLNAGERRTVSLRVGLDQGAPASGFASLDLATDEGLTGRVDVSVTTVSSLPLIGASPSYIDTGITRGSQRIENFTISNSGSETLRNPRIEGPSLPWLALTVDKQIGEIPAGQSRTVGIMMRPDEKMAQGVYDDRLVIYSDNHVPYSYNIQVTVTSSAVGNVQFSVLDELMKDVSGASLSIQHQSLPELYYSVKTGSDGSAALFDIPEGRYSYNISAPGRKPYSGSFVIVPGITATVPVAMEVTLVTVEWSVTPVVIEDRYDITVSQTFETNVPTAVIVTEPPAIVLPALAPGQVFNGEFTVTNHGLVAADYAGINFPSSFDDYDLEVLANIPAKIAAGQKIVVPYRITRRQVSASASLLSEVRSYGGSCSGSNTITLTYTQTICPGSLNERTVNRTVTYTISWNSCPAASGGPSVAGTPPAPSYGPATGSGGQSSGGSVPPGTISTTSLSGGGDGDGPCIYPRTPNKCPDCNSSARAGQ